VQGEPEKLVAFCLGTYFKTSASLPVCDIDNEFVQFASRIPKTGRRSKSLPTQVVMDHSK